MSSWKYIYLFPPVGQSLDPTCALGVLHEYRFEPASKIRPLVQIDIDGHLGEFGDEVSLEEPFRIDLYQRLKTREQLFVEWHRFDKPTNVVFTLASSFPTKAPNPHINFSWPQNLFQRMSAEVQKECMMMMQALAKSCGAAYVIIGVDLPDDFEDRFLEIDRHRVLDSSVCHRYGHGIEVVWVDKSCDAPLPEGVDSESGVDVGSAFVAYVVKE